MLFAVQLDNHAVFVAWTDSAVLIRAAFFVLILELITGMLTSTQTRKPPRCVRLIGDLEFAFGTIMALPSLTFLVFIPAAILGEEWAFLLAALAAVGFAWCLLAIQLLKGKSWARYACLILSVARVFALVGIPFSLANLYVFSIRILTLLGIPISFLDMYVLCKNRWARAFFEGRSTHEEVNEDF